MDFINHPDKRRSEIIKYFSLYKRFSFIATLNSFTELLEIEAFRVRYEIVMAAVNLIGKKPFFGYLETPISITDNFYIMFILRYGLVPFTILSIILIILKNHIYNMVKAQRRERGKIGWTSVVSKKKTN